MSDEKKGNRPSYHSFVEQEGKDGKSHLKQIGASFAHKDGEGHTIKNFANPIGDTIILRTPRERLERQRGAEMPNTKQQGHER